MKTKKLRRDVFQAIADPTRRAILTLVAAQAMTPNMLAEEFESTRQAVSKHIRILVECQLMVPELSGREIYYHIDSRGMKEVATWLEPFRALWTKRHTQLDALLQSLQHSKE